MDPRHGLSTAVSSFNTRLGNMADDDQHLYNLSVPVEETQPLLDDTDHEPEDNQDGTLPVRETESPPNQPRTGQMVTGQENQRNSNSNSSIPTTRRSLNPNGKRVVNILTVTFSLGFFLLMCLIPFVVLAHLPNPTTTSKQSMLQKDTIPLHLSTQAGLPPSFNTYWYDTIVVKPVLEPSFPVEIFFVEGNKACNPLANRTQVDASMSSVTPVDPTAQPVDVIAIDPQYLTAGSTLLANLTLTTNLLANTGSGTLTLCILDNREDYENLFAEKSDHKCKDVENLTFPVSSGSVFSVNYTFHESSYYYIVLISTMRVYVQFSYQLTYQFYEKADYIPTSLCSINKDNNWKDCVIKLNGTPGCLFGSCPPPVDSTLCADLHVTVYHKLFTTASIAAIVVGLLLFIVLVVLSVFTFILHQVCQRRDSN